LQKDPHQNGYKMSMEVYSKLPRHSRRFEDEVSRIESEYNIQRMEAEVEYHRKMSMTFENSLVPEQERLSRITRRQRENSRLREHIRDATRQSRGDGSE